MATASTSTVKLVDILSARIAEGEQEKMLREVQIKVKQAEINASQELFNLELTASKAAQAYELTLESVNSSLTDIVSAKRNMELASANYNAALEVKTSRF
jgi:hypothetical protein